MELSLHGSQISLATRFKPQQPTDQYPSVQNDPNNASPATKHRAPRRRPESANGCLATSASNRCGGSSASANKELGYRQLQKRPLSADHRHQAHVPFASNQLKRLAGQRDAANKKFEPDEAYRNHSSSSNILNDLLAESIKRSVPKTSASKSLGQQIKAKASMTLETDDDNESSIEEDLQDLSSGTNEDDSPGWSTRKSTPIKPLKLRPSSSTTNGETNKKYVTFSKQNTVLKTPTTPPSAGPKPDLPGRVSFSNSDVFAIDLSDGDDDPLADFGKYKFVRSSNSNSRESSAASISSKTDHPPKDSPKHTVCHHQKTELSSDCCSMKCNSLIETTSILSHRDHPALDSNRFHKTDESDRIIADYKREIEKLNREHDRDVSNIDHNLKFQQSLSHVSEESSGTGNRSNAASPQQKDDEDVISKIITNAWKNHQSKLTTSDTKTYTKTSLFEPTVEKKEPNGLPVKATPPKVQVQNDFEAKKDSSSVVISNYLKTTSQKPLAASTPVKKPLNILPVNSSKSLKTNNMVKGSSKSVIVSSKPAAKPVVAKRATSAQSKPQNDDNRLNEFHMEKVESWMSIHEFNKEPTNPQPAASNSDAQNNPDQSYNQSWRDTPCSKTDDEGMFSFDDLLEGDESTYDDIVSVIKEIDEQKTNDLEATTASFARNTLDAVKPLNHNQPKSESPDKMKEILSYLDRVESSCEQTMHDTYSGKIPDSFRSEIEFAVEPDIIGDMPKMVDLLMLPNQQLARRVIALSLRANELSTAIQLSREHMASVRTEKTKSVRAEKQTAAVRMADQKRHFESVVQRHQGFIEQLLQDKQALGDKVTGLVRRIDSQNQAWQHKLETETARVKDAALAGEKIRRERWVRENTKKIKELTVKGLEQEINAMTGAHQKEIAELKRLHQQDLLDAVEEVRLKHEQLECGIRESYALDRESAIEKERNAIRERFERQIESEQRSFEEQKSKLLASFAAEKKRWHAAAQEKECDFERRKIELVEERRDEVYHLKSEHSEKLGAIEMKHLAYQKSLQDQFEKDFAIWKREHEAASSLKQVERENAIRLECRLERDRQIDAIVAKVDAEAMQQQTAFDVKVSRINEKHDAELKELERSERNYREKNAELRTKLSESEANRENIAASSKQLDIQLQYTQQLYDELLAEKDTLKAAARREVDAELAALRKDRDAEIERIYARVQTAVEKKDAAIEVLHKDGDALKERCIKLEAIVRQQRQDYFVK